MTRTAFGRPLTSWLLIVPSLALALFIIGYPLYNIVFQSVHELSRFGLIRDFCGLDNFRKVFAAPIFIASLWRTLWWTLGVIQAPIHWLAAPNWAFPVEILVGILVSVPFTVTIFLGGLSSVPGDIYAPDPWDPATVDGLLRALALPLDRVAVELNGALVRRLERDRGLREGDVVEIVTLVGGG